MHHTFRDMLRRTGRLAVQDFVDLLQLTAEKGRLPVVNFAAGGLGEKIDLTRYRLS